MLFFHAYGNELFPRQFDGIWSTNTVKFEEHRRKKLRVVKKLLDAICFYGGILILAFILEDVANKLFGRYF